MAGCTNNRCMWTGEKTKIFHHLINQKISGISTCRVLCCQGDYLFSVPLLLHFFTLPIPPWSNKTSIIHSDLLFFCLSLMEAFKKFVPHWDGNQATVWLILKPLGNRVPPLNVLWKTVWALEYQFSLICICNIPRLQWLRIPNCKTHSAGVFAHSRRSQTPLYHLNYPHVHVDFHSLQWGSEDIPCSHGFSIQAHAVRRRLCNFTQPRPALSGEVNAISRAVQRFG